jgi:hypothetical protein
MSPDGKTHTPNDHILIDRQRYSSILDVRTFRKADCDPDHHRVVTKVRERHISYGEKLNEVEGKGKYYNVSNRFAALEDLETEVAIHSAWELLEVI